MQIYKYYFFTFGIIVAGVLTLIFMGQPLISNTGHIYLFWFNGGIEDSQQIFDWYSFSHIIHGLIFYFLINFIFKKINLTSDFSLKLFIASSLEVFWEVLENSPIIINRYREGALAAGYFGDSVLNSAFDIIFMCAGFFFAYKTSLKFGWKISLLVVVIFELLTLYFIRDNLTLNIVMLLYPFESISAWQIGG